MLRAITSRLKQMFLGRTPSEADREAWQRARAVIKKNKLFYSLAKKGINFIAFFDSSIVTYWYAVLRDKPYFGGYLAARQNQFLRIRVLLEYVEDRLKRGDDIKILEVGSWAGQSAVMLASLCKKYKSGKVFCIDTWEGAGNIAAYKKRAQGEKIMKLFLRNVRASGAGQYIVPMRGRSDSFYDVLKSESFDAIYIDGDHSYDGVVSDIKGLRDKVKKGGMLCGDDYDCEPGEIDAKYAMAHKEKDYIPDPTSGKWYHPGVVLGVRDTIGKVNKSDVLWWVIR
ncbi:MAG: class I SAM-dependent methyltransferase [Candidatus Liptonbacteria bacterium]|nr:class I SAM-dependent methyltransferase [Candidatus Liptonbacteria bacterium]